MPGVAKRDYSPKRCVCGDHAFARTSKHGVVLVDVGDERHLATPWQMAGKGYAQNNEGKMHRIMLAALPNELVDHQNHDKMDNRRRNLRLCDNFQSIRNRSKFSRGGQPQSKFKGVTRNG